MQRSVDPRDASAKSNVVSSHSWYTSFEPLRETHLTFTVQNRREADGVFQIVLMGTRSLLEITLRRCRRRRRYIFIYNFAGKTRRNDISELERYPYVSRNISLLPY